MEEETKKWVLRETERCRDCGEMNEGQRRREQSKEKRRHRRKDNVRPAPLMP